MTTISEVFSSYTSKCLEIFAESIKTCDQYGSQKWGITIGSQNNFRLVMGNLIVASIEQGAIWFAVTPGGSSTHKKLDEVINWRWTDHLWAYKNPPSHSGYYWPMANHNEVWQDIQRIHYSYLAQVADVYDHLRSTSQKSHSNDFLVELGNELGVTLPTPIYHD